MTKHETQRKTCRMTVPGDKQPFWPKTFQKQEPKKESVLLVTEQLSSTEQKNLNTPPKKKHFATN